MHIYIYAGSVFVMCNSLRTGRTSGTPVSVPQAEANQDGVLAVATAAAGRSFRQESLRRRTGAKRPRGDVEPDGDAGKCPIWNSILFLFLNKPTALR